MAQNIWCHCLADDVYPRPTGPGTGLLVLLQGGHQALRPQVRLVGEGLQEESPLGEEESLVGLLVLQLGGELQQLEDLR